MAANRLMDALNRNGVKAKMLVRDKETDKLTVVALRKSFVQRWRFLYERWCVFCHLHFSRNHLFDLDMANTGTDITKLPEFKEADVVHLHWVNQGMLSLADIQKILDARKPLVWTMHDIWPATALCHLTLGCPRFESRCMQCKYLPGGGSPHDLSSKIWKKKQKLYSRQNITFVACSKWLAGEAKRSKLLKDQKVVNIPNTIDTHIFKNGNKEEARRTESLPMDKRLVLFVAQRATNPNKGMAYLAEACRRLEQMRPETKTDTAIVILGGHAEDLAGEFSLPVYPLGYVSDTERMVRIYNAVDAFVLPSLSENLPNTIMEALACGVPCIGFQVGGIPEMIEHRKNGYVAKFKDAADLAEGLRWVLHEAPYATLSANAVSKVAAAYSQQTVAMKYIEVYNHAAAYIHFRL